MVRGTVAFALTFLAGVVISLASAGVGRGQTVPSADQIATPVPTQVPGLSAPPAPLTSGLPDWWFSLPDKPERPFPFVSAGTHNLMVPNRKCLFLIDYALRVAHHPMPVADAQLEEFSGTNARPGDSGSPVVTDDVNLNFVGQLTEASTDDTEIFAISIIQIRQDALNIFGIGALKIAPAETVAQGAGQPAPPKSAAKIWPTVSQAQAEAEYPELAKAQHKAEAAITANAWVLKVPHVKGMMPWFILDKNVPDAGKRGVGETGIRVWVDKPENVREVEGQVPSQLSGVPVVVQANSKLAW